MARGPRFPQPSPFWQAWAWAGIFILLFSFGWGLQAVGAPGTGDTSPVIAQLLDGLRRFTLLVLTPALIGLWLAAGWFRARGQTRLYWQMLGALALLWGTAAGVSHFGASVGAA